MTRTLITATVLLVMSSMATLFQATVPAGPTGGADVSPATFTREQRELVDFAYGRFARADLDLAGIKLTITFTDDESRCYGYGGVYVSEERVVRICRPSKITIVHELAHAWLETTLVDSDRRAFLNLRGLEDWTGGASWDQRGAEQSAEIITWAMMEHNISVRWLEPASDGATTETWRLFKVPNTDPDELVAAYEQLTGSLPRDRIADDPRSDPRAVPADSPEARRIGS